MKKWSRNIYRDEECKICRTKLIKKIV
jgi:hypothetical protein